MAARPLLVAVLVVLLLCQPSSGVLEWLFGDGEAGTVTESKGPEGDGPIRFEILSTDEKFLDFAKTLGELSPLDACYNIVIYSLKSKCGDLSEEELGKLSVQLLNCQSEAEDRPVFPCFPSMSLADCTKAMDGTTWNSYQIVGNRARAMCYSTQQVQFRRLTEQTVNRLVAMTTDQVQSLTDLKAGQDQLAALTSETVRKLYESQQDLLETQHKLRDGHESIFKQITGNIQELTQEKALITTGNRELAMMTASIMDKLEKTTGQIKEREIVEQEKHERILRDLKDIQDNTDISVRKLNKNLEKLLRKYEALDSQYGGLTNNLATMNTTVNHLMTSVTFMQGHLDDRITWISQLLGGADDKLAAMSCCLLHIAYFFLLAVSATFLQISVPVRLAMMVVIVGNVAAELNYDLSLDFAGLTVFLATLYGGFKFTLYLGSKFSMRGTGGFFSSRPSSMPGSHGTAHGTSHGSSQGTPLSAAELKVLQDLISRMAQATATPAPNGAALRDCSVLTPGGSDSDEPPTPPSTYTSFLNRSAFAQHNNSNNSTFLNHSRAEDTTLHLRSVLDPLITQRNSRSASRSSTPVPRDSRSSTPSSISSRCLSNTVAGSQCRIPAMQASDFCRRHANAQSPR